MSPLFVILACSLITLGIFALSIALWRTRPRPPRPHSDDTPPAAPCLPVTGEREIGLKVCPECRELVLLAAASCKYCGTAQSTAPFAPHTEPPLKIPRPPAA